MFNAMRTFKFRKSIISIISNRMFYYEKYSDKFIELFKSVRSVIVKDQKEIWIKKYLWLGRWLSG